jgi:hypothetical protein
MSLLFASAFRLVAVLDYYANCDEPITMEIQ